MSIAEQKSSYALTTPDDQLQYQGQYQKVRSLLTGKLHPTLQRAARSHAKYQADNNQQGHQQWDERVQELTKLLPGFTFKEICAESWPWQTTQESASEMYHCWRQSPGHWAAANSECVYYGYAMARSDKNIWYACGILAIRS